MEPKHYTVDKDSEKEICNILKETDTCFALDCNEVKECTHTGHGCAEWKRFAKRIYSEVVQPLESLLSQAKELSAENYLRYHDEKIKASALQRENERFKQENEKLSDLWRENERLEAENQKLKEALDRLLI